MKHLIAALSLLLLLSPSIRAQEAEAPPRVRIGTWNIENLGSRRQVRGDGDYARLAAYVKELGVDVLGVQEVNGAQPLTRLCRALGPTWRFVVGTSGTIGRPPEVEKQITVGFVFDEARVELLEAHELNDLPQQDGDLWIFHRIPVVATFRARQGGLDFRAIVVHLKAGRLNVSPRSAEDSAKRQAEVRHLGARLTELLAREGEDQDLVVLGDFNSGPTYPAWKALAERLIPTPPAQAHQSIVYFDEQIDHLFLSAGLTEELVPGSCRIRAERFDEVGGDAWKAGYSDHIPVVLDLDASHDRDPDARFTPGAVGHQLHKGPNAEATAEPPAAAPKPWF